MAFISRKKINGIRRYYLEKSIRLPGGKVKKFSVYLKDYDPKKKFNDFGNCSKLLDAKISKEIQGYAAEYYNKSGIFDAELLKRMEEIKLGYRDIINKITKKQLQDIIDR